MAVHCMAARVFIGNVMAHIIDMITTWAFFDKLRFKNGKYFETGKLLKALKQLYLAHVSPTSLHKKDFRLNIGHSLKLRFKNGKYFEILMNRK